MSTSPAYLYVLTALASQPRHGLGIAEVVEAFTGGAVVLGPGTLYRCLKDLSADGLIAPSDAPSTETSSHRKYYALTEAGRGELGGALVQLERLATTARRGLGGLEPLGAS